jgi:hypothetical protein
MEHWTERLEKIRARTYQSETNSVDYWSVTLCQEDRRFLLDYVDKLQQLHQDSKEILSPVTSMLHKAV